ncbi:probable malonyl-CoA-acyl carrier protein transacylase, mitochondrial [Daphnia carinata]|uniref:probable malonyl-CoA-acyl carrier protein transacylase, mitochondrial n=1 Tax=Daphnia carinata TaxID=120202 RepID=UPI00257E5DBA|nr:probable malonyl-CoA-acyl carrier protein transacylase, mitochondrial [Daphnia carinata]
MHQAMALTVSFGLLPQRLVCGGSRKYLEFLKPKRLYARGSRYFPTDQPPANSKNDSKQRNNESNGRYPSLVECAPKMIRESPRELLENAASFKEGTPANAPKERMEDVWNSDPYPKGSNWKQSQAKYSKRPGCDPRETSIILFPGQGTQFVGMGKELLQYPLVKQMYDLASSVLGYNLLSLCLDGPKETLNKTVFCQPAILVSSLACVEKLKATNPEAINSCIATAGFSIGEITALVFSKAITFENAVRLVKLRAEAMQFASDMTKSGMMTVFFGPNSKVNTACAEARRHCEVLGLENIECKVANYLYPECKVIAGNIEALDFIEKNAARYELRRLKRLPVSGAFHTNLMEPVANVLSKALKKIPIQQPIIAVHSNVDGKRYRNAEHIFKLLPQQIIKPVCWEQTMHILYERNPDQYYPMTYECGPGSSLKSILRMVNAKAAAKCTLVSG